MLWFDGRFDGPYLILALLVFSMTFPASFAPQGEPRGARAGELARDIAGGWLVIASAAAAGLGLAHARPFRPARHPRLGARHAVRAVRRASPVAGAAAAPAAQRGLQRTAVIAGANEHGRRLAQRLLGDPLPGTRVAGFFDDRDAHRTRGIEPLEDLGSLAKLADYVKAHRVDVIYIALPMASQPRILKLLEELRDTTASIYFVPDIFVFDLIQARVDTVGGMPVLAVCETPFYGVNGLVKRVSDIVLAALILVAISPLMLAIAVGVKLCSPGPVLFRQRRYGLDGQQILVYKFRSMTVTEDGAVVKQATRNDSRVTPFGAFLRRTSLDELPQFINVLQGRMSIVGPRPHAVAHNELYRKLIRGYMIRHKVRPASPAWRR